MNGKYRNPPINEAICELFFLSEPTWDWTAPGLFFNEIKDNFPDKKEVRGSSFEFLVKKTDSMVRTHPPTIERIQFWTKDEGKVVQIGENRLILNKRKPYNGWEDFKSFVLSMIDQYSKITGQLVIQTFILRYMNKIVTLPLRYKIEDYFNYYPNFPSNLETAIGPLQMLGHFPIELTEGISGVMKLAFVIQQEGASSSCFLDTNLSFNNISLKLKEFEEILEESHSYISKTFEACITEQLRKTFR